MVLLTRVHMENKSSDWAASVLLGCISLMYLSAVDGRWAKRSLNPFLSCELLRSTEETTPSFHQSQTLSGWKRNLVVNPLNVLTDLIPSIPGMMWHLPSYQHQRLLQMWQISTEEVLRFDLCRLKTRTWRHKQTAAENLSPLTTPFRTLFISLFISCQVGTAASVMGQERAAWFIEFGSRRVRTGAAPCCCF